MMCHVFSLDKDWPIVKQAPGCTGLTTHSSLLLFLILIVFYYYYWCNAVFM